MDSDFSDNAVLGDFANASGELERIGNLADAVGKQLSRSLKTAITDGANLKTVLAQIGKSLADIALKAALKPIGQAFSGFVNNLFTATNPVPGVTKAFAKGGVVAWPSYFPLASGGTGLMGEAGAEAILPLARGADGRLGVRSAGGQAPIHISMAVNTPDAKSFVQSQAQVSAMLSRAVGRGQRSA